MSFVLALDQGTTSSRAILFDAAGAVRAVRQQEFRQHFPRPGWVEHDPQEIWETQLDAARRVLADAGIGPRDVAGIGITNQRETVVVWDRRTGEPIHNAIVWQDRRTAEICDRLRADGAAEMIGERTGLVPDAYFSGPKIAWLLDHVRGARQRAEAGELAFGTIDAWLMHRLTGGALHVTDVSNASRTMLFNIHTGEWDEQLLELLNVPRAMMPQVRASSEVYGTTSAALGLGQTPIAGIAGDQQAALAGQLCFAQGMSKCTYGTGCFLLLNTGNAPARSENGLLTTIAWKLGDATTYALEGSVFIAGAVVQWLRDGLGIIRQSSDVEALATSVPDNGGVYLVPAFAGLGAPHWDQHARGIIAGLTRGATAGHIARAAVEAIAFQVADLFDAMQADVQRHGTSPIAELRVDGGAAANDLLMQFQADLLRISVQRPAVLETTALGAAVLAGLAVGFWKEGDLEAIHHVDRQFEPALPEERVAELRERWADALRRSRSWAVPER